MAKEAYRNIEIDVGPLLPNWHPSKDNEIKIKESPKSFQEVEGVAPLRPQEEFIISLIKKLRKKKNKGIHSVYSGFNGLFKEKFPGDKPQAWTKKMAEDGRIVTTRTIGKPKEYQMIYLAEDAPKS